VFLNILFVFLGGGAGSVCRYGLGIGAVALFGPRYGWGTLCANVLGCFLIGILGGMADRAFLPEQYRLLFITGFLGGLTTFSSFSHEVSKFLANGDAPRALLVFCLNLVLGLVACLLGMAIVARGFPR
jgi:fluoride exporter